MTHTIDLSHKKLKKRKKAASKEASLAPMSRGGKKHQDASVSVEKIEKIEWKASEFTHYKKGKKWFFYAGLIAVGLILVAILLKNFLLIVIILLSSLTIYQYSKKKPRKIKFIIDGQGIQIENQFYSFENLKSFWIFYSPASSAGRAAEIKELSIRSKKSLMPYIKIPLDNQDPTKIRKLLIKFLPERRHQESIIDNWARRLRF